MRLASALFVCFLLIFCAGLQKVGAQDVDEFSDRIAPLLDRYCVRCHRGKKPKGEFDLTKFPTVDSIMKARTKWRHALEVVREDEMPPEEPLPTREERRTLIDWLESVTKIDWSKVKTPGHVTLPRLTRDEYDNTMRDLLGIDLQPGSTFSEDGEGNSGFNTDRDSLFVTPAQMEKYFEAAERSIDALLALRRGPIEIHLESEEMFMTETKEVPQQIGEDFLGYVINRGQMTLYDSVNFPADGVYEFRVRALSTAGPTGSRLRINNVEKGDIIVPSTKPEIYTVTCSVRGGSNQIAWNIQVPPATALRKQQKNTTKPEPPKKYRKLPGNANQIISKEAPKTFPRYPAMGDESAELKRLITAVDNAAHSLQRPYEWLRLLQADGEPQEIVRFKGYIVDRTKTLEKAKDNLAQALSETRKEFDDR